MVIDESEDLGPSATGRGRRFRGASEVTGTAFSAGTGSKEARN